MKMFDWIGKKIGNAASSEAVEVVKKELDKAKENMVPTILSGIALLIAGVAVYKSSHQSDKNSPLRISKITNVYLFDDEDKEEVLKNV